MSDDFAPPEPTSIHLRGGTVKQFAADLLKNQVVLKVAFHLNAEILALQEPMASLAAAEKLVDVLLRTREAPSKERQMSLNEALSAAISQGDKPVNIRTAILAEMPELPPFPDQTFYQYVVAGNGLFIRAADTRLAAMVPVVHVKLHGLADVQPYAHLLVPPIPVAFLESVLESARRHLPNEAMYQFLYDPDKTEWRCVMPDGEANEAGVQFQDQPLAVADLHSHGNLDPFFSDTDNRDEQGLRFYAVIGNVGDTIPDLQVRVGVYGWRMDVPATALFEDQELFIDLNAIAEDNAEELKGLEAEEATEAAELEAREAEASGYIAPATDTPGEVEKSPVDETEKELA